MSNGHPLSNLRGQGVRIPENQSTEQAPVMQITNVARMQAVLVEWGNERGQKETSIAFVLGDAVYVPPNYAGWTLGFRTLVESLSTQVVAKLEAQGWPGMSSPSMSPAVPSSDAVDVVSGSTDDTGKLVASFEKAARAG